MSSSKKLMRLAVVFLLAFGCWPLPGSAAITASVLLDVEYSRAFERCKMDLWLPTSASPSPAILFFHGGAFRKGSKERIPFKSELTSLTERGFAFASVGYPLLEDQGLGGAIGPEDYEKILLHAQAAVDYIRSEAAAYNIDASRIIVAGSSAGALIAEHIAYRVDHPSIKACVALQQPYETRRVIEAIQTGEPPMVLFTSAGQNDLLHSPDYAMAVKAHCDKVGVLCHLFGNGRNGLPALPTGRSLVDQVCQLLTGWLQTENLDIGGG